VLIRIILSNTIRFRVLEFEIKIWLASLFIGKHLVVSFSNLVNSFSGEKIGGIVIVSCDCLP